MVRVQGLIPPARGVIRGRKPLAIPGRLLNRSVEGGEPASKLRAVHEALDRY